MRYKFVSAIAAFTVPLASTAYAHIVCHEDFQVVNGREIATPYCQDNTLAQVSRGYGRRVSDAEVRNNPGLKDELCRNFGSDIRVKSACASSAGQEDEGER
jgi:hypothetical protein